MNKLIAIGLAALLSVPACAAAPPGYAQAKKKARGPVVTQVPTGPGDVILYLQQICTEPALVEGDSVSKCKRNRYDVAKPTEMVKRCPIRSGPPCAWEQLVYSTFGTLADAEKVEVCGNAIPPGTMAPDPWSAAADLCKSWLQLEKSSTAKPDYFTAVPGNGTGTTSVLLKWQVYNTTTCVASGGWGGQKSNYGEQTVTIGQTTTFILDCGPPANQGAVTVQWDQPMQNTDGSSLTDLAGYRIYWGLQTSPSMDSILDVPDPTVTQKNIDPISFGDWKLAMKSYNRNNVESAPTDEITFKVDTTTGRRVHLETTVTVTGGGTTPKPPINLEVSSATALLHEDGRVEVNVVAHLPE